MPIRAAVRVSLWESAPLSELLEPGEIPSDTTLAGRRQQPTGASDRNQAKGFSSRLAP
jgi:hypothetical protein